MNGWWLFKYKCYEVGYPELAFKKYLLLKKFFFWKSSCSQEVSTSKKYMLWIITSSEEVAPLKQ